MARVAGRQYRPMPPIERRTHIAFVDLLRRSAKGWLFMHIPNGEYRSKETGALLQRMGVLAGAFDLLLISPAGVHHWLELKRSEAETLTDAQLAFQAELDRRGVPNMVAFSFDQAVTIATRWQVIDGVNVQ